MKRYLLSLVVMLGLMIVGVSCTYKTDRAEDSKEKKEAFDDKQKILEQRPVPSLKEVYKDYFPIGAAIEPPMISNPALRELLLKQFNSVTAENKMKMHHLRPWNGTSFFHDADRIVNFALQNNMKVRGHTLIWHGSTPESFFFDKDIKPLDKELLLKRMENYIKTVVGHFKGRVYCWDVVNEAIVDGVGVFRRSMWLKYIGKDYIEKAFRWAHEADPGALLFYNDYSAVNPEKRQKIYKLLKRLKKKGVPIHGVGIQGHWNLDWPPVYEVKRAIKIFASLGVEVQITEMDISVYSWRDRSRNRRFTDGMEVRQAKRYKEFFEVFRQYRDVITGVTLWGLYDGHTWLDMFPVKYRKNWPLLFDVETEPKRAFWEIVEFRNRQ
jgi:endo-1,4-beta-xylanase